MPAAGQDPDQAFALFPAGWTAASADSAARQEIVGRAVQALDRRPGALRDLHTEGLLPGHATREAGIVAKRDQLVAFDLALAWRLTGDRRFLTAASRYLEAWANIYQQSLNPIDETGFDTMVFASDLVRTDLPLPLRLKLNAFWRRMAVGYLDAMDANPRNATTNWQSHRVKLAAVMAFASGNKDLVLRARNAFRRQVGVNILPDGSVKDFHTRDALHYVTYDLDPLLLAALVAKAHGEDWFSWRSRTGSSLPLALRWLEPYADGRAEHIEFVRSQVPFDRERAAAGDTEYAPHAWRRGSAVRTYALATLCDKSYARLLSRMVADTRRQPSAWLRLVLGPLLQE
ncbi:MAG: alginate lyase family protein [Rhizorhabdus sp.]